MTVTARDQAERAGLDSLLDCVHEQDPFAGDDVEPLVGQVVNMTGPGLPELMKDGRSARRATQLGILSRGAADEIAVQEGRNAHRLRITDRRRRFRCWRRGCGRRRFRWLGRWLRSSAERDIYRGFRRPRADVTFERDELVMGKAEAVRAGRQIDETQRPILTGHALPRRRTLRRHTDTTKQQTGAVGDVYPHARHRRSATWRWSLRWGWGLRGHDTKSRCT